MTITSKLEAEIMKFENPYPKDVFSWDNKEKLDFNRGRFNRHCFEIVENTRKKLLVLAIETIEQSIREDMEKCDVRVYLGDNFFFLCREVKKPDEKCEGCKALIKFGGKV